MSVNTEEFGTDDTEDSAVIRELRDKVKELNKKLATQGETIRGEVAREQKARELLPAQYRGLTQYLVQEVDGDLTPEAVNSWLSERVGEAPLEVDTSADEVADVANLGSEVANAPHTQPMSTVDQKLRALEEQSSKMDLFEYNRQIESILNGA